MQFTEAKKFIMNKLKKELPKHLFYHSVEHIKDVYDSAKAIAKAEKIKKEEKDLLLTAALFHDSGFIIDQKEHERLSSEIAEKYLPDFGYTPEQIKVIRGMIMATKIPQSPKNHLEEIICDADLDYLGRDDFFVIGDKLFAELSMYGIIDSENDWNKLQVTFLEKHHYFTKTAIKNRKAKKEQHLELIKSKIS
ncbi:MAG TPA: HD domain-containing protein [Flavipsychrobacter sp.]|nr:HD domain-containing protein [Flavipsychrobacter sp.]